MPLLGLLAVGCMDEESSLGINLVDNNLVYNGKTATLTVDRALSVRDDSLLTTNYSYGIIGNYHDATFGRVSAELYSQIALDQTSGDINLSEVTVDSVTITLFKTRTFPDTTHDYTFHFEVMQLAEPILSDTLYYAFNQLPVNPQAIYFDDNVTVRAADSLVTLRLNPSITSILTQQASAEEFLASTKGLRIRLTDAGDEGMFGIDFTNVKTSLTLYYHNYATDTASSHYRFLLGTGAMRFLHFEHDYTGAILDGSDSIDGTNTLYLEPMGGYNLLLSFDQAIKTFADAHPYAAIHMAELLLPVASGADADHPDRIIALGKRPGANDVYIDDMISAYSANGFDGRYNADSNRYRLRITQHLQGLLRDKADPGLLLLLDSRRHAAQRTIIAGPQAADPVRLQITYTE